MIRTYQQAKSFVDPQQPGFVILYVTNRCNFRCSFCFYYAEIEKGRKPDELTLDELEKISRKFGPVVQLSLTGGEPFLRDDLADITRVFVKNSHVRYLTIPTNAWLTDRIVHYLERSLPQFPQTSFRIVFSIDGIGEAHDRNRSAPGSYQKIQESYAAVSPLRRRYGNLTLDSNTVYSATSEPTILETVKTIHRDFHFDNISITYARGNVKDPSIKQVSHERYVAVNDYLATLARTKERRPFYFFWRGVRDVSREHLIRTVFLDECVTPCVAGRKLIIISETGDVHPCEILNRPMGNLRDYDYNIHQLLRTNENHALRRWIVDTKCKCSFECALAANVAWNPSTYLRLAKSAVRNIGTRPPACELPVNHSDPASSYSEQLRANFRPSAEDAA